jgi:hypothetical protein
VNLGCAADGRPNSPAAEATPVIFEDETGTETMYFASNRDAAAGNDIFASRMGEDDTFGPAAPVVELNAILTEQGPAVRRDGLEIVFASNRPGTMGDLDLWSATRATTADAWSEPVRLPDSVNSLSLDGGKMSFSFDGRQLYFRSNRPVWGRPMIFGPSNGSGDIYVLTREKLPPQK